MNVQKIDQNLHISLQMWLALLGLVVATWTIITYTTLILEIGWIVLGAFLLALGMRPAITALAHWRVPRPLSVLAIYLLLFGFLLLLGNLLLPILRAELIPLQKNGPALIQTVFNRLAGMPLTQWIPSTDTLAPNLTQQLATVLETTLGTVAGVSNLLLDFVILLILTLFLAADENWLSRLLLSWTPSHYHIHIQKLIDNTEQRLTRWVWSQPLIGLYFAVTFSAGLMILGVPFALTIGLIGGVLEIVPYLGGIIATMLAVLSALVVHPGLVIWVIVLHVSISLAEGHLIAPLLYGHTIGLRSAVVLIALFVGAKAAGILGVFFAVPVAIILSVVIQEMQTLWLPETRPLEPEPATLPHTM